MPVPKIHVLLLHIISALVAGVRLRMKLGAYRIKQDNITPPESDDHKNTLRNLVAHAIRSMYPLDDYWNDYCLHQLPTHAVDLGDLVANLGTEGLLKLNEEVFPELKGKQAEVVGMVLPHLQSAVMVANTQQACDQAKSVVLKEAYAFTLAQWLPEMQKAMTDFTSQINVPELPDSMKDMVKSFISGYFDDAPLELKLPMIEAYFTAPPLVVPQGANMDSPEVREACFETMGVVLQGGGPFVHKMLQSAGDKVPEDLRRLLAVFKDGIKGMSSRELLSQAQLAYGLSTEQISELMSEDGSKIRLPLNPLLPAEETFSMKMAPTNAASIGQGHLAEFADKKKVWVKVKRPFLREKMTAEFSMLDKLIVGSLGAQAAVKEIKASIEGELDWKQEFAFMRQGEEVYNEKRKGVRSVHAVAAYPADDPTIIIMEALQGKTLAAWIDADVQSDQVCNAAGLFRDAFQLWAREALVVSGFFHGDPHAGNLYIDNDQLTFIDFGNSYQTNGVLLYPFAMFAMGTLFRSSRLVLAAFEVAQDGRSCQDRLTSELNGLYERFPSASSMADYASACFTIGTEWCSQAVDNLTSWCEVPVRCKRIGQWLYEKASSTSFDGAERLAHDTQNLMMQSFKVLIKNAECVEFPDGLFNFGRALDLLSNSFAQMLEKKREQLEGGNCLHLLQSPVLQIVHSLSWFLTMFGLKASATSLAAGLGDAIRDNSELLLASFLVGYAMSSSIKA